MFGLRIQFGISRAVDPGTGTAFIFILLNADPDPGGENLREKNRKNARKMEENCNFIRKYGIE